MAKKKFSKESKKDLEDPIKVVPQPVSMGVGEIGRSDVTFSRKFRWTLEGTTLPSDFVKSVSFDFIAKNIRFEYYDVVTKHDGGFHVLSWADRLQNKRAFDERLVFTTLDGCGEALNRLTFKHLSLLGHTSDFDYSSSENATQNLVVKYEEIEKEIIGNPDAFKSYQWMIRFEDESGKVLIPDQACVVKERPKLDIEGLEVDHLNGKVFVPGKARWQDVTVLTDKNIRLSMVPMLMMTGKVNYYDVVLSLRQEKEVVETWHLQQAWAQQFSFDDDECQFTLRYKNVKCESPKMRHL